MTGENTGFDVLEAQIRDVMGAFQRKETTAEALVETYLARINRFDKQGPALRSILTVNQRAFERARELDQAYQRSGPVGPLHGIPIVLKDNFNTHDLSTTGGSLALRGMQPIEDAEIVARLRQAGAIILAKANMHELALKGMTVSSLGGQCLNPYDLTRTPGGSSGGTAVAVAANLAMAGTGTDTVNSIRSPASANCLVGIRPTNGLLSNRGIMPVSVSQDVPGPIARSVADAACLLEVMAGSGDYARSLETFRPSQVSPLSGKRIGILSVMIGREPAHSEVTRVVEQAIGSLRQLGANMIELDRPEFDSDHLLNDDVELFELKAAINAYLAAIPNAPVRSLSELIASGRYHHSLDADLRTAEAYANGRSELEYSVRRERISRTRRLLSETFEEKELDAIIYPLQKRLPVSITETQQCDRNGILAALTGFPAINMPVGWSSPTHHAPLGIPIGLDLLGRPWSEGRLLSIAQILERHLNVRRPPTGMSRF